MTSKTKTSRPARFAAERTTSALGRDTLKATRQTLEAVSLAEQGLGRGEDVSEAHDLLRTAALALLSAYSVLENLPDPRDGV